MINILNDAISEFNVRYLSLGFIPKNQIISQKVRELISIKDPNEQYKMGYDLFGSIYDNLTMDDIDDLINLV